MAALFPNYSHVAVLILSYLLTTFVPNPVCTITLTMQNQKVKLLILNFVTPITVEVNTDACTEEIHSSFIQSFFHQQCCMTLVVPHHAKY